MIEWNQVLIWLITSMSVHTCLNEVLDEVFFCVVLHLKLW